MAARKLGLRLVRSDPLGGGVGASEREGEASQKTDSEEVGPHRSPPSGWLVRGRGHFSYSRSERICQRQAPAAGSFWGRDDLLPRTYLSNVFTGLIEAIGTVRGVEPLGEGRRLSIAAPVASKLEIGESVAVDGVCLTVVERGSDAFAVEAVRETVARTTVGRLETGRRVNLERALAIGDRLGGHFVQGHVDGVATVQAIERQGENRYIHLSLPEAGRSLVAERGSIAVNGVSLTVLALTADGVRLSIVPHTWAATAFPELEIGDPVNVEYDLIARYLKRLIEDRP